MFSLLERILLQRRLFDRISLESCIYPWTFRHLSRNMYLKPMTTNSDQHFSELKMLKIRDETENLNVLSQPVKQLIEQHFEKFGNKLRKSENVYIINDEVAGLVVQHMKPFSKGKLLFEANPGPGLVTKALLEAGVPHLRVFEKNKLFLSNLEGLKFQYQHLEIVQEDILHLPLFDARDSYTGQNTISNLFEGVPTVSWQEGPPLLLFATLSPNNEVPFTRHLLAKLPVMSSIFAYGRCEFLFFMSGKEYTYMTAKPKDNFMRYRSTSVLYNLLFDLEFIAMVPKEHFYPKLRSSKCKMLECDNLHLYLIRCTPKQDLSENVPLELLPDLCFFIKQHLMKRRSFVIPSLEKWIPYCGPRLIKEGMALFTRFGDLSPEEILWVFHQFSSWPEYPESIFKEAVMNNLHFSQGTSLPEDEE